MNLTELTSPNRNTRNVLVGKINLIESHEELSVLSAYTVSSVSFAWIDLLRYNEKRKLVVAFCLCEKNIGTALDYGNFKLQ